MNRSEVRLKPKSLAYKLRKEVRCLCAQYPKLYFSQRGKLYGYVDNNRMINADTEIVIDGYPCSANTFAEKAFNMAQERTVNIAHHTHDPSQLIAAAKANVPAIVLVRNPEEAVLSFTARFCNVSNTNEKEVAKLIYHLLREYLDFYRRIIKYRELYIIAEFKTLTSSYDLIIKQLNHKYGVNFTPFYCNDKNLGQVFLEIDKSNKHRLGHFDENIVARPSLKRKENKAYFRTYLNIPKINKMLKMTYDTYYEITS